MGMNDSTEIGSRFSYFNPHFARVDENDYSKGYYVKSIVYQNDGGRWFRVIEFDSPESIDTLIFALVYAKEAARHQRLCGDDDTYTAVRNSDNSCKAVLKDGVYKCEWCGTPHPLDSWGLYEQGKPRFCMHCGAFFREYDELRGDSE